MARTTLCSSSHWIPSRENSILDYDSMQDHRDNGAADFGRMLDAGLIPGQ